MHHRMPGPNSYGMFDYVGGYSPIWMILFWVVLGIFIIYLIIQFLNRRKRSEQTIDNTPLTTLQERLARGEISPDEYENLKSILQKDQQSK